MTDNPDSRINTTVPTAGRRYNALLGGKDNFEADRASATAIQRAFPAIGSAVAENRRCLLRTVRYLTAERGIRQFLDIGCGFPIDQAYPAVHEVAQQVAPGSRIVYVDNDAMVAVHARALWCSTPEGAVTSHLADLRQPTDILAKARDTLDFAQPVAVLVFAVLHFLPDAGQARTAVGDLMAALPTGSYLALSHATFDPLPDHVRAELDPFTKPDSPHGPFQPRTRDEVAAFLTGLDLVEPGLVSTVNWHPHLEPRADRTIGEAKAISFAALAVKP